jgi:membrane protein
MCGAGALRATVRQPTERCVGPTYPEAMPVEPSTPQRSSDAKTPGPALAAAASQPLLPVALWRLACQVFNAWVDDYGPSMGAALAYYTMFSMAPLLLIVIAVAGLVFGEQAARGEIAAQLSALMGPAGADAVQSLLTSVRQPAQSGAATVLGLGLLLVGATTVFGELQDALDRIWRVPVRSRSAGWVKLLRARLLSFGMILAIGFLLMVSLVLSAILATLGRWWSPAFGGWLALADWANTVASFALVAVVFALIYKVMPRARVQWRDVIIGALVTATLFSLGKALIGVYIGRSGIGSAFGAAGSLVVVLVWVYYSAQIFLLGAEFTWVFANTYGSRRHLDRGAGGNPGLSAGPAPETAAVQTPTASVTRPGLPGR